MPAKLQRYVHNENIARYQKLIAESGRDPSRDEARHQMLLRLLADELAKQQTATRSNSRLSSC